MHNVIMEGIMVSAVNCPHMMFYPQQRSFGLADVGTPIMLISIIRDVVQISRVWWPMVQVLKLLVLDLC